eukprot:118133-Chlamydomonas_euryale.AAC.1
MQLERLLVVLVLDVVSECGQRKRSHGVGGLAAVKLVRVLHLRCGAWRSAVAPPHLTYRRSAVTAYTSHTGSPPLSQKSPPPAR